MTSNHHPLPPQFNHQSTLLTSLLPYRYSESRRHAEKHGNSDENVEPVSRLSYWWSSVYDESGAVKQRNESAVKRVTGLGRGKRGSSSSSSAEAEGGKGRNEDGDGDCEREQQSRGKKGKRGKKKKKEEEEEEEEEEEGGEEQTQEQEQQQQEEGTEKGEKEKVASPSTGSPSSRGRGDKEAEDKEKQQQEQLGGNYNPQYPHPGGNYNPQQDKDKEAEDKEKQEQEQQEQQEQQQQEQQQQEQEQQQITASFHMEDVPQMHHMLQAARKMAGWEVSHRPARMHPVKFHKMACVDAQISFIQRGQLACAVVRSCLTSVGGLSKQLTLAALLRLVSTSHFHVDQYVSCYTIVLSSFSGCDGLLVSLDLILPACIL
jgi:hypothetical protein